jgi:hypothetical protein
MVDPKYLQSDVFGRYFVLIWKIFCAYLEDILCLPKVVHVLVQYYPYISMWKHANFLMVFEYYCLCSFGSGIGDPKYL